MTTPSPSKSQHRDPRWTTAALVGLLVAVVVQVTFMAARVWNAEPQSFIRDGLYPGGVFVEIDVSGDPDIPFRSARGPAAAGAARAQFTSVPFSIELQRYGTSLVIYYDRLIVMTTGVRPPLPVPPPGWGAAVLANKAKLKDRVEFVAHGLDKADVDWLAVGRGETWSHTDVHWDAVLAVEGSHVFFSALWGVVAGFAFFTVAAIRVAWRVGRYEGRCLRCGYRIGVPDAVRCPECGEAVG